MNGSITIEKYSQTSNRIFDISSCILKKETTVKKNIKKVEYHLR